MDFSDVDKVKSLKNKKLLKIISLLIPCFSKQILKASLFVLYNLSYFIGTKKLNN